MLDREPFLHAIFAAPADDVPRLVFADWLDEHGDAAWAELIRVSCERHRLPTDDVGVPVL
ncbi:MAG: TIGR02996 domain-containing protein [Fimbriiglobus sp.]